MTALPPERTAVPVRYVNFVCIMVNAWRLISRWPAAWAQNESFRRAIEAPGSQRARSAGALGCLMRPRGMADSERMPGMLPASRRSDDERCRAEAHGLARGPLQEVTGARSEGQADRCRVWSGLVGGVPPAGVLGPAGFQVRG